MTERLPYPKAGQLWMVNEKSWLIDDSTITRYYSGVTITQLIDRLGSNGEFRNIRLEHDVPKGTIVMIVKGPEDRAENGDANSQAFLEHWSTGDPDWKWCYCDLLISEKVFEKIEVDITMWNQQWTKVSK